MISAIENELNEVAEEVFLMIGQIHQSLQRLEEIALKPDPLSQEEYIDLQIESEKRQAKPGWKQRVAYFEEAKRQLQVIKFAKTGDERIDEIMAIRVKKKRPQKPGMDFSSWVKSLRFLGGLVRVSMETSSKK
ncbi:MAG: hypothetical protein R3A44_42960 [Caldilineaceae bacterium]